MDKRAIEVIDGLLVFISTLELFRARGEPHLRDVQKDLLKHQWIADAVRYLKDADSGDLLTLANANWIELLEKYDA